MGSHIVASDSHGGIANVSALPIELKPELVFRR